MIYDPVFPYLQFVNDLHALISPPAKGTPLPLILLGKVRWLLITWDLVQLRMVLLWSFLIDFVYAYSSRKNAMLSTFLFLDQIVWAGRTGIYKVWISFHIFMQQKDWLALVFPCVFEFGIAKRTVLLSFVFCFHINKGNKLMQKCYSLISRPVWILGIEFILIIAI